MVGGKQIKKVRNLIVEVQGQQVEVKIKKWGLRHSPPWWWCPFSAAPAPLSPRVSGSPSPPFRSVSSRRPFRVTIAARGRQFPSSLFATGRQRGGTPSYTDATPGRRKPKVVCTENLVCTDFLTKLYGFLEVRVELLTRRAWYSHDRATILYRRQTFFRLDRTSLRAFAFCFWPWN